MYQSDYEQRRPAVPPLHPMDPYEPDYSRPYEPMPQPYNPAPYEPTPRPYDPISRPYEPTPSPYDPMPRDPAMPNMPYMDCPMMDPRIRDCIRVCMMMRCGDYPMNTEYENSDYTDPHELSPYYNQETE